MAAESASLSTALDRHLYLRLLFETILYGQPDLTRNWPLYLKIPGALVTDAKSLYDHLTKIGSVPTERQTLIDLLYARDLHEHGAIIIKWLPNRHMIADCLTKPLIPNEEYDRFYLEGKFSMVPTEEQVEAEAARLEMRRNQRLRAKERLKALKEGATTGNELCIAVAFV